MIIFPRPYFHVIAARPDGHPIADINYSFLLLDTDLQLDTCAIPTLTTVFKTFGKYHWQSQTCY